MDKDLKVSGVYASNEEKGLKYHEIHREWLDSLGATVTEYREKTYSGILNNSFLEYYRGNLTHVDEDADIYVIENSRAVHGLPELQKRNPEAEKIYLATSWNLFGLQPYNLHKEDVHNTLRAINELVDTFLLRRKIKKYCDRIITVSPLYKEKLGKIFPKKEISIVKSVSKNEIEQSPNLETNNAIFVGAYRDHKGVDILVKAWPKVREEIEDATLTIVGKGHKQYEQEGVETRGYVENLEDEYKNKSLYIHPARIDAFPVSTIEAMKAGFPTIVTDQTGTKSEVTKVSEELISEPRTNNIVDSVVHYFGKAKDERKQLSTKVQNVGEKFTYDDSERDFRRAVLR